MNPAVEIFEFEPFRHEFEVGARFGRGARSTPRRPPPKSTPWPSFRKRRILRTPSIYGGWGGYPPALSPEPQAEPEPASAASSEDVRWLQATLNRATGGALPIDGVMSPAVRDVIRDFQRSNRLPVSGYIGPDTDAALRRVDGGSEIGELEFETESELSGTDRPIDDALWLDDSNRMAFAQVLELRPRGKSAVLPTKPPIQGLYRIFSPPNARYRNGGFYTGCAKNLRTRLLQHQNCLTTHGVDHTGYKVRILKMDDLQRITRRSLSLVDLREIERRINRHHRHGARRRGISGPENRRVLNPQEELEFLELSSL